MGHRDNLLSLDEPIEDGLGDLEPLESVDDVAGQPQADPDTPSPAKEDEEPATDEGGPADDEAETPAPDDDGEEEEEAESDDSPKPDTLRSSYDKVVAKLRTKMTPEEYQDYMDNEVRAGRGAKPRTKPAVEPATAVAPADGKKKLGDMTPEEADEVLGGAYERRLARRELVKDMAAEKREVASDIDAFATSAKATPEEVNAALAEMNELGLPVKTRGDFAKRGFVVVALLRAKIAERTKTSRGGKTESRAVDKARQITKVTQPKGGGHLGGGKPLSYSGQALQDMQRITHVPLSQLVKRSK